MSSSSSMERRRRCSARMPTCTLKSKRQARSINWSTSCGTNMVRPIPGADLLMSNIYDQLMPEVVDTKDLGSGVIGGVECDHLAFRTKEVDWQIWIAQGSRPYPCRYVITSTQINGSPQYTHRPKGLEDGGGGRVRSFRIQGSCRRQETQPGRSPRLRRVAGHFCDQESKRRSMTMVKRIRMLLVAAMFGACASS